MSMDLTALNKKFPGGLHESSMVDTDYDNGKVHWITFAGAHCPICGHTDWCVVNVTGTKVICMRHDDGKAPEVAGGHLYELKSGEGVKFDPSQIKQAETVPYALAAVRDILYRMVLIAYPLAKHHLASLKARGLTDEEIHLHGSRGFGSFYEDSRHLKEYNIKPFVPARFAKQPNSNQSGIASQWEAIFSKLGLPSDVWKGVPGFYLKKVKVDKPLAFESKRDNSKFEVAPGSYDYPNFTASTDGLLVPYYDELNRIISFQTRVDHVSMRAEILEKPKRLTAKVHFGFDSNKYYVTVMSKQDPYGKTIATGTAQAGQKVTITKGLWQNEKIVFEVKSGGKYFWVSSSHKYLGASGKTPVQVAYQPGIAKLEPTDPKLDAYIKKPKAVWLTEGGLKALVAAAKLPNNFSAQELDEYGHDFIAVAGVGSYRKFVPMLKKLNVKRVTVAFDMDFLKNPQVANHYRDLINLLHKQGYKVRMALWNPQEAKGIDDALVAKTEIKFKDI